MGLANDFAPIRPNGNQYEVIEGKITAFSSEQLKFVEFVASRFDDLIEVLLIDERGYEDIWFVFPDLSVDKPIDIISDCMDYFEDRGQNELRYLLLTPENIVYDGHFPLVMLKLRGCGNG